MTAASTARPHASAQPETGDHASGAGHACPACAAVLADPDPAAVARDERMRRDLKTLGRFIEVACKGRHPDRPRSPTTLRTHDVAALLGHEPQLCCECQKLLTHAFVKRTACPMDPKPQCKHCPNHCYHPRYRAEIREVMKFSGKHLLLRGRVDYLLHLLF